MSHASIAFHNANADTLTVDYYLSGDTLIIASESLPGRLYLVTSTECTCPAGRDAWPCQHAVLRLNLLFPRSAPPVDTGYLGAVVQESMARPMQNV